jgi:O-antigen ligase
VGAALTARRLGTGVLLGVILGLLAVAGGRAALATEAISASPAQLMLWVFTALVALVLMIAGPIVCLAALVGLSMITIQPSAAVGGGLDLKAADAFYVALVVWGALRLLGPRRAAPRAPTVRSWPILLLAAFAGLTLLHVAVVDPGNMNTSLISWLRLVQTISVGFLAALFVRSPADARLLLSAVALAGTVAVGIALIGGVGSESETTLGTRGGGLNPNTLGLVSGLLVLMACLSTPSARPPLRILLGIAGAIGLVQSQSIGALVGTCVAVTLGLVLLRAQGQTVAGLRSVQAVGAVVASLALAYAVGSAIRPENLPHSDAFKSSSAWHRTVVGSAGLELASRNPIIGVGWRRSSDPEVIGDADVARSLRERFAGTREEFFPDVSPTSVHNAYIQIAAELGLIGLALLGVVLFSLAQDIRRLLGRLPLGSEAWRQVWYLAWGAVLILIWLNDNPLFGGQAETVMLATFVGVIAGLGAGAVQPADRTDRL